MSSVDPAFNGAGKKAGLELWRVENKKIVKLPKCNGKFYKGDSYILLATVADGPSLIWKLHFWLGSESSQDEMGIVAYKTVELDEALGGGPVQFREVEGHESTQFMSYFKNINIEYLPGGVASGFNKVERDSYRSRLLHVKGKRIARVNEISMKASSLNIDDVFILDLGLKLFLYFGAKANQTEKSKGVEFLSRLKDDERGGRAEIIFIHEDPKNKEFWGALGGYQVITAKGESDAAAERVMEKTIQLRKINSDGSTDIVSKSGDALKRELLESGNVYLLDTRQEIFVWIGREASPEAKKEAMISATHYLSTSGLPTFTRVTRVAEDTETMSFKALFNGWTTYKVPKFGVTVSSGIAKKTTSLSANSLAKMAHASEAVKDAVIDDGSGELTIWRIENFEKAEWPKHLYGQFYRGDSYILLYSYEGGKQHIIYFWQGHDSTVDEVGASALLTKELDEDMGGQAVQVRVTQGKEPTHFRSLFKGGMVTHFGGHSSGFSNTGESSPEEGEKNELPVACFHVKGTYELDTYGVQVPAEAASLNSGDSFVVITSRAIFLWNGKNCGEPEALIAAKIGKSLQDYKGISGREFVTIKEGSEPAAFWAALGGEGPYPEARDLETLGQDPRLFQISNATGSLAIEEIHNFDQSDLCNDDVMLLDTFKEVYIWIGGGSNDKERSSAMEIAKSYVETATDGRAKDIPIVRIVAGSEPPMFTQHFRGWDSDMLLKQTFIDPFEAKMKALKEKEAAEEAATKDLAGTITIDDIMAPKGKEVPTEHIIPPPSAEGYVPYELLKGIGKAIEGVDADAKELSLSPKEFKEVFGMTAAEFSKMPKWKQVAAKKQADLF
jgi:hypothetical protein